MERKSFKELKEMLSSVGEALVITGCDITGDNENGWINGITLFLKEAKCIEEDFKLCAYTMTTGGRTDIVFFLPEKINIGRLAIKRLAMDGATWLSDYVVNHKDDHR